MTALSSSKEDALACEICSTKEGMERPIGRVMVELKEVEIEDTKMILCQVCYKNKINMLNHRKRHTNTSGNKWIDKLKNLGFVCL